MTQGVYILIKDFDILYVGASTNVESRLYTHRNKDYDHYVIVRCGKRYQSLETRMISFLKPILNKMKVHDNLNVENYSGDTFRGLRNGKICRYLNA